MARRAHKDKDRRAMEGKLMYNGGDITFGWGLTDCRRRTPSALWA